MREVLENESQNTLIDYQMHIKTGGNSSSCNINKHI